MEELSTPLSNLVEPNSTDNSLSTKMAVPKIIVPQHISSIEDVSHQRTSSRIRHPPDYLQVYGTSPFS